jgi:predicted GIY-YIG superfamily endonuclease
MEGEFVVYIMKGSKKRYIGCTSDLPYRIDAHNKGLSKFTRSGGPWILEWKSKTLSHTDALQLEKLLKKQKGGIGIQKIMNIWRGS